jgi:RHS repeat-associated protein
VRVLHSDLSVTTRYFHTDNLGSIAVITDESGTVVERDSYDAWGKRRFATTWGDDPSGSIESQTTRGFTGQEELADVGLVHLNGRVYDPLIGRMLSADPFVPDPLNGQAWNRYSYVINNPLAFTDPNGYCFLGMCSWGKAVSTFFGRSFGVLFRKYPIFGELLEIGAVLLCGMNPVCAVPVAFASTTFVAGVTSGSLGYALKAGFIAAATAVAFYEVGNLTDQISGAPIGSHTPPKFGTDAYLFNVAGHAAVGCASAVASGGKCGAGALSAGIPAVAGPAINGRGFASLVANSVLGGAASVAGGGKFANGAVTAAFGYMLNSLGRSPTSSDGSTGGEAWVGPDGTQVACGPCIFLVPAIVLAGAWAVQQTFDILTQNPQDQAVYNTRAGDLPATGQDPNSTQVKDDGNGNGQIRDYGPDGRAVKDFDFGHDHGAGDPHVHDWD